MFKYGISNCGVLKNVISNCGEFEDGIGGVFKDDIVISKCDVFDGAFAAGSASAGRMF